MAVAAPAQRDANVELRLALVGTTCVRLKQYDLLRGYGSSDEHKYVGREEDPAAIEFLVDHLQVDDTQGAAYLRRHHCLWVSDHAIEFYNGARMLASLSAVRGMFLRWHDVWPGDPHLLPDHIEPVFKWLAARGVTSPLSMYEDAMAEARQKAAVREMATCAMPTGLRQVFLQPFSEWRDLVAVATLLNVSQLALAGMLFRVCGATNEEWVSDEPLVRDAVAYLSYIDTATLVQAVENALLGDVDRIARRGAVRAFVNEHTPDPTDLVACRLIALDVLQESRCLIQREVCVESLRDWAGELPLEAVETRLLTLLADPNVRARRYALAAACLIHAPAALPLLMDLLQGKDMPIQALPPVPVYEDYCDHTGTKEYYDSEGTIVELAGLALGYHAYEACRPFLLQAYEAQKSAYLAVALALLADFDPLKDPRMARAVSKSHVLQQGLKEAFRRAKAAGADIPVSDVEKDRNGCV